MSWVTIPTSASIRFESPLAGMGKAEHELSGISAIIQDDYGFIWFGGENALGRYDGQSIKLFKAANTPGALPSNYIWDLVIDQARVMWIGTAAGLARYDVATDSFATITAGTVVHANG